MNHDTKLITILRQQYSIMITDGIWNTEYIFLQLAINVMPYCHLKIAISL